MSRWLSSLSQVSNLLEKLDDRVENVVEERAIAIEDEDIVTDHEVIIDDILSKRGLAADSKEEEEEAEEEVNELDVDVDDDNVSAQNPEDPVSKKDDGEDKIHISQSIDTAEPTGGTQDDNSKSGQDPSIPTGSATELQHDSNIGENRISAETLDDKVVVVVDAQPLRTEDTQPPKSLGALPTNSSKSKKEIELSLASKEAQKEVRVLRRHVVKLNSTLEQAEGEILALRDELGRAAERMEKDRTRAKELKEAAQKTQVEELATIRKQHEQALKDQQIRFEEQLETYKSTLSELENRRKQEGGDWNKEIAQAFEREQEMNNRVTLLEYVPQKGTR